MSRHTSRWLLVLLLLLASTPDCAHAREHPDDRPLYEELLFAEIDKDRPKPRPKPPLDDLIDDQPATGTELSQPVKLRRPAASHWQQRVGDSRSQSVGLPNRGSLRHGRQMARQGTGFIRKNDKAPFGTDECVAIVEWACERMAEMYPGSVPVVIGNLSVAGGGRLKPHASHQSGRDMDIGYYFVNNEAVREFRDATPDNLDIEKSWSLIELLLSTHEVEYLFIDQELQPLLHREARARGWEEEELQELFAAPVGARQNQGIIRHSKGHSNHLHVRFKCATSDSRCK